MSNEMEADRRRIAAALHEQAGEPSTHPTLEALESYALGRTTESESSLLQEHLLSCPECVDLLLDLSSFLAVGNGPSEPVPDIEAAAAWRALRSARRGGTRLPKALAATFAAAAVGLGAWTLVTARSVSSLRSQIAELSRPRPNQPIVDLYPESAERGSIPAAEPLVLGPEDTYVTVILNLPGPPDAEAFEARIATAAGQLLWRGRLEISAHGTFRIGMPTRLLGAEGVQIKLFATHGDGEELLESYPLRVVRRSGSPGTG